MIPLNFYRDDNYVYYNNPNGITKKMTIADFEAMMSGEGGSDIPEHSSSNQGEVLSVDANGDLVWKTLPAPSGGAQASVIFDSTLNKFRFDKTISEVWQLLAIYGSNLPIDCHELLQEYSGMFLGFVGYDSAYSTLQLWVIENSSSPSIQYVVYSFSESGTYLVLDEGYSNLEISVSPYGD